MIDAGRATVFGLSAIHALWATGSPFPFSDQTRLSNAVQGTDTVPSAAWCLAVSGALALGAARAPRVTAAAFAARGVIGLARPRLLPAGGKPPFATLNAWLYSPGCLLIAAALAKPAS